MTHAEYLQWKSLHEVELWCYANGFNDAIDEMERWWLGESGLAVITGEVEVAE